MIKDMIQFNNTVVCINFTYKMFNEINKISEKGNLHKIHIFVFDLDKLNISELEILGNVCRRFKKKCIIHCFNNDEINRLRFLLKGVAKNQFFHLSMTDRPFVFNMSQHKTITVEYRMVTVTTKNANEFLEQKINYDYGDAKK